MRRFSIFFAVLFVACMSAPPSFADVAINAENFPDDVFRSIVSWNFDRNYDRVLDAEEIKQAKDITFWSVLIWDVSKISSLEGIKYLTCLEELNSYIGNNVTSLDLGGMSSLKSISWFGGKLSSLNVSGCVSLEELSCGGNEISVLDLSGCPALKTLYCGGNEISALDLSNCPALEEIYCAYNQIVSLDLSTCPALKSVNFSGNKITVFDISGCVSIEEFYCADNQIVSLDLSGLTALESIDFSRNKIAVLNVSGCVSLKEIDCSVWHPWNETDETVSYLTSIIADGCTSLKELRCYGNRSITSLSVRGCASLQELNCRDNKISSLDLGGLSALEYLRCNQNELSSLNVNGCSSLEDLDCDDNQITSLDLGGCGSLVNLYCCNNQIISIDLAGITSLHNLYCDSNDMKSLNLSGCTGLSYVNCSENEIEALDLKGCRDLYMLECYSNKIVSLDLAECYSLNYLECQSNDITALDLSDCNHDLYDYMRNDEDYAGIDFIYEAKSIPEILTQSIDYAFTGDYCYTRFIASGGAVEWSVSGKLPPKTELTKGGSLESDVLKKAGNYTFTLKAENSLGSAEKTFTLSVFTPIEIKTWDLKDGTIDKSYSMTVKVKGSKPITFSASGLPKGLSINPNNGKISGKPEECGDFDVLITVSNPAETIEEEYSMTIKGIAPKISGSLKQPELNKPYSSGLKLTKGTAPVYWEIEGDWLPNGLEIDEDTGIISGVPEWGGTYKFTVTAYNDWGSASKKVTMKVKGKAPKITTSKLPDATAGTPYTFTFTATGDEPIYWEADELPAGLVLSENGTISGTPEEASKKFTFTVWAANPMKTVKKKVSIRIIAAVSAEETSPQNESVPLSVTYGINDNDTGNSAPSDSGITDKFARPEQGHSGGFSAGYVVIAELGEISCDEAGIYDFGISLSDDIPEGAELIYIANSDKPSDDDDFAEFYDYNGKEITAVPDNRAITISVWLNPERIYKPVIAIKR